MNSYVWRNNVNLAKKLVMNITRSRIEVARLTLEACDIKHGGGGHWSKFEDQHTVKKFAEEIGINHKTLHEWIRAYVNVYEKIKITEAELPIQKARRVSNQVNKSTPVSEVKRLVKVEQNRNWRSDYARKFLRYSSDFATCLERGSIHDFDRNELLAIKNNCQEIVDFISTKKVISGNG